MKLVFLLTITIAFQRFGHALDLEYIRTNYSKTVKNKELCKNLIDALENSENSAVMTAYLGGLQAIWANHVNNPISKLNTFTKGKKNIELALKKDSNNIEIRYIRLSIQKNSPTILGYQSAIKMDEEFIEKNKAKVTSYTLKNNIDSLLNK